LQLFINPINLHFLHHIAEAGKDNQLKRILQKLNLHQQTQFLMQQLLHQK